MGTDFEELLALFLAHGVEFVVVGGHAVAFHAKPRYTKDIDVFVRASTENGNRICAALDEFGFGGIGLEPGDFAVAGPMVQLGMPPNRVDILTSITGVSFDEAWQSRVQGHLGRTTVHYIGRAELIENKRAADRPQDRVDVALLADGES
jgi:hypothetical protein